MQHYHQQKVRKQLLIRPQSQPQLFAHSIPPPLLPPFAPSALAPKSTLLMLLPALLALDAPELALESCEGGLGARLGSCIPPPPPSAATSSLSKLLPELSLRRIPTPALPFLPPSIELADEDVLR